MRPNDPIAAAMLRELAHEVENELGPGILFALFVDWRDGGFPSYTSNADRSDVVKALAEWIERTSQPVGAKHGLWARSIEPELEKRAAGVARQFVDEDCDAVVFLFTDSAVAWYSSMPARGREIVRAFVKLVQGAS